MVVALMIYNYFTVKRGYKGRETQAKPPRKKKQKVLKDAIPAIPQCPESLF